jgi:hypothetical protein
MRRFLLSVLQSSVSLIPGGIFRLEFDAFGCKASQVAPKQINCTALNLWKGSPLMSAAKWEESGDGLVHCGCVDSSSALSDAGVFTACCGIGNPLWA